MKKQGEPKQLIINIFALFLFLFESALNHLTHTISFNEFIYLLYFCTIVTKKTTQIYIANTNICKTLK